jgi:hypothetical protein|tara:strand:- start:310 stop:657 length:348 start_codon:yes stop_codon:yes gene_type:complete
MLILLNVNSFANWNVAYYLVVEVLLFVAGAFFFLVDARLGVLVVVFFVVVFFGVGGVTFSVAASTGGAIEAVIASNLSDKSLFCVNACFKELFLLSNFVVFLTLLFLPMIFSYHI